MPTRRMKPEVGQPVDAEQRIREEHDAEPYQVDAEAIARLAESAPGPGELERDIVADSEEQRAMAREGAAISAPIQDPAFPPEPDPRAAWEGDISIPASVGPVSGRPSTTTTGQRGSVRFLMEPEVVGTLIASVGKQAFDLTFQKCHLGDGWTIGGYAGRPDQSGGSEAHVDFVATEQSVSQLGQLFTRRLIGAKGMLVLGRSQVTMDEILTRKAD